MSSDIANTAAFVAHLRQAGIKLIPEGGNLRVSAPAGTFTPEIRNQVSAQKAQLLLYLADEAGREPEPTVVIQPASREGSLPFSFGEKGLWIADQMHPGQSAFNWRVAVRLTGSLNLAALTRSLNEIIRRHEVLRTTIAVAEGEPVRVLCCAEDREIPLHILSDVPEGTREDELQRQIRGHCEEGFDLSRGPLVRAHLWRLNENEHVLLIVTHHIVSDGWSLGVIGRELGILYRSFSCGEPVGLPELALQYVDYAVWQHRWSESPDFQRKMVFWRRFLAGAPALLELPTDRPRPSARSFRGGLVSKTLPKELSDHLETLGRQEGSTLFMTLLAAFNVLLRRYTRQDDLVVGTPVANRAYPELENLIGFFVNVLPLRTRFTGDPTFRSILRELRESTIQAFAHQDVPFDKLVEVLHPNRTLAHTPLFQVLFALQKDWESAIQLGPDLVVTPLPIDRSTSQYDLSLYAQSSLKGLHLAFEYSADLFEKETIRRMLQHFEHLLEGIVAAPETRVSRLPLLEVEEQERIVVEWNQTRVNYGEIACLHELFQAQVDRSPESVAVVFEGRTLTYRDLEVRANQVAHFLRKLGVAADSLVGICVERSLEMVIGLLGILKAGGAYVPLDPSYPEDRLAFMLEDAGVSVLLSQNHVVGRLPSHRAKTICLDADWDRIARESRDRLSACARPDNLAYMIYTSGSTGRPKGAMITHRGIFNRLLWMQEQYRLSQNDAVLQKTPFSFDVSVWEFFWPLLAGARLVVARPGGHQDPAYLIDVIAREHITITHFVPSMLRVFLEAEGLERCGTLREVICSGEALAPDLVKRFYSRLGANLHNLYGPTEAAVDVTYWSCPRGSELSVVPIGRPLANTQCYILDAQMQPVPVGVPGELHLGGVQVGRGYYRRPELTAEKFIADPFSSQPGARLYKTGDLCRYLPDGCIEYLGRIDHQVKLRGFRIELGEVEACLAKHPRVKDVVVVVRNDPSNEPRLAAYLVGSDGPPVDPEELREYLRARLPEYMMPSVFVVLDKLPLSPSGKIDRKALPIPSVGDVSNSAGYVPPRTEIEKIMAEIWAEVLGVKKVSVHDNFFELGGHSLLATRLIARLRSAFQIDLPLRSIFAAPTIAGMSDNILYDAPTRTYRYVSEIQRWKRLVPAQPKGSRTPLFLVAGYMDSDDTLRVLSRIFPYLGPDQPVFGFQPRWLDGQSRGYSCVEEMALECLVELRAAQPKGPYLLGGDCVEGVVAFEIARELLRQGEEVRLLVMFDTLRPTTLRTFLVNLVSTWDRIKHIGDVIGQVIKGKNGSRKQLIKDLVRRKFASAQTKTSAESASDRAYRSRIDYRRMIHRHRVKEYAGRITLLVNEKQYRIDKNLGWKGIALGGLEIYSTPGDHMSRYNVDHKEFAERVRVCLERAQC